MPAEIITLPMIIEGGIHKAEKLWREPVLDIQPGVTKPSISTLTSIFTDTGWAWFLKQRHPQGLPIYIEKTLEGEYEEYCGLFWAYCLGKAGDHLEGRGIQPGACYPVGLKFKVGQLVLPGTPRLASAGTKNDRWARAGVPPAPIVAPADIVRGNIVTTGKAPHGSHIVMALTAPDADGYFETLEGNAYGELGNGLYGEGVVRRRWAECKGYDGKVHKVEPRHIDEVQRAYELLPEHAQGIAA